MFKLLGLALIFGVCCLGGIIFSFRLSKKESELKDIIIMLDKLKSQIEYSHTTVKQIMKMLSGDFPKLKFINDAYIFMCDKCSFKDAWEKAVLESDLELEENDINLLCKLGDIIGAYDTKTQIKEIKVIEKFLSLSYETYLKEKKEKSRLFQSLGVLFGLMFVMIMA